MLVEEAIAVLEERWQDDPIPEPPVVAAPIHADVSGVSCNYIRFAALGDSLTYGLGDFWHAGSRGWARILADAIGQDHEVSFCNTARPGATAADVREHQIGDALVHRPHLASLIVGLNDTMRASWNPALLRSDVLHCATRLAEQGAVLMTVRFHDHSRIFRLPRVLARPMRDRIDALNDIYDEVHERFGSLRVDLGTHSSVYNRAFWSIDRLHPSELGHRALAHEFARLLDRHGVGFQAPTLEPDGPVPTAVQNVRWMLTEGVPWLTRRVGDLAPSLGRALINPW